MGRPCCAGRRPYRVTGRSRAAATSAPKNCAGGCANLRPNTATDRRIARAAVSRLDSALVQCGLARLSGLHPRRRPLSGRTGRPDRRRHQPLYRRLAGRTGAGAARGQRARVVPRLDGIPARHPRAAHHRRVDVDVQCDPVRRERQLGTEIRPGVLYTSTQAHQSVVKSAKLAGIIPDRVRTSRSTRSFAWSRGLARRDRRRPPRWPAAVPGRLESRHNQHRRGRSTRGDRRSVRTAGLWHHVDGAYGAFFTWSSRSARCWPASRGPTRSRSTRTRVCSCRTAPAHCWCVTARPCARCTGSTPATCLPRP